MITQSHIIKSIFGASAGMSELMKQQLDLPGMSSAMNRHLLNNLARVDNLNYLEIGVHQGSTFISSLFGNTHNSAYAIDDWSQFTDSVNQIERVFQNNCALNGIDNYKLIQSDSFKVNLSEIKHKINMYFYDGHHSEESTRKALTYYYDVLDDEFIYVVDDINWDDARNGALSGIKTCNLKVKFSCMLPTDFANDVNSWWNGIYVALLKK